MAGDEKENRDESEPSPRVVRRCAEESEDDGDAGTRNRLGLKRVKLRYRFGVGEIDEEDSFSYARRGTPRLTQCGNVFLFCVWNHFQAYPSISSLFGSSRERAHISSNAWIGQSNVLPCYRLYLAQSLISEGLTRFWIEQHHTGGLRITRRDECNHGYRGCSWVHHPLDCCMLSIFSTAIFTSLCTTPAPNFHIDSITITIHV